MVTYCNKISFGLKQSAVLLLLIGFVFNAAWSKDVIVSVEYLYQVPDNVSPDEAKGIALERAQAQAIADEFGTIVTQSSSVNINTVNGETRTDFLSIGGSELKGEWIETINEPKFEYITDGEKVALKVKLKGRIRELAGSKVPFDVKILRNGIKDSDESEQFQSGDQLYLSFNSPSSGYIAVYLIDPQNQAFCLLPYQSIEDGNFKTKSNHRYVFFNPTQSDGVDSELVDEYILETEQQRERDRILVVFSPNRFFKAADNKTSTDLPRNLGYLDFQKWLSNIKKKDVDMSIVEKAIIITL